MRRVQWAKPNSKVFHFLLSFQLVDNFPKWQATLTRSHTWCSKETDSFWSSCSVAQACLCCTSAITHCKSHLGKVSHDNNILRPLPSEMLSRLAPLVVLRKCCNTVIYHCRVLKENWMHVCVCLIFQLSSAYLFASAYTTTLTHPDSIYLYCPECVNVPLYALSEWTTGLLNKMSLEADVMYMVSNRTYCTL